MEEQEIDNSSNGMGNSSLSTSQNFPTAGNPRKASLNEEERKLLSARILGGKTKKEPMKSILRKHSNTIEDRHSARSLTSVLGHKVSFARNKLDLERVKYFTPDSGYDEEPDITSVEFQQVQSQVVEEDKDINDEVNSTQLASSLFAASKEKGGLNDMIQILRNGASARGFQNQKPLDEVKKQIGLINEEMKTEKEPERYSALKRIKNEFKLKSAALKIYKEAELCVDLARNVRGLKTIEFTPLSADDLYRTSTPEDSAHFVYAQIFVDGFPVEPHMPMIPFSSKINWRDMGGNRPYYITFDIKTDAKYRPTRNIRVDLMKGKPAAPNEVKLGSWETRLLDIEKKLSRNPGKPDIITSALQCTDYLMEGAYMEVSFKNVRRDQNIFRRKRHEYLRKIGQILEWIKFFQKDTIDAGSSSPLINADISYFDNTSLLHAAVYLFDSNLVDCLLQTGADVARKSRDVGTAIDLSCNLWEESKRRKDGLEEEYRIITDILKKAKAKAESKLQASNTISGGEPNLPDYRPERLGKGVVIAQDMGISNEATLSRQRPNDQQHHWEKRRIEDGHHHRNSCHVSDKNVHIENDFDNRPSKLKLIEVGKFDTYGGNNFSKTQNVHSSRTTPYHNIHQGKNEESYGNNAESSSYNFQRSTDSACRSHGNDKPKPSSFSDIRDSNERDDRQSSSFRQKSNIHGKRGSYTRSDQSYNDYKDRNNASVDRYNGDRSQSFPRNDNLFGRMPNNTRGLNLPSDHIRDGNRGVDWRNRHDTLWGSTEKSFRDECDKQDVFPRRGSIQRNGSLEPGNKSGWEGKDMKDIAHRRRGNTAPLLDDYSLSTAPFFPIKHPEMNLTKTGLSPQNAFLVDQVKFVILPEETKSSPIGHCRVGIVCSHCRHGCKIDHIENWFRSLHTIGDHMATNCTKVPDCVKSKLNSPSPRIDPSRIWSFTSLQRFCGLVSKHYKLMKPSNEGKGDSLCIEFDITHEKKKVDTKLVPKTNIRRNVSISSQAIIKSRDANVMVQEVDSLRKGNRKQSGNVGKQYSNQRKKNVDDIITKRKDGEAKDIKRKPNGGMKKDKPKSDGEMIKDKPEMKRNSSGDRKKDRSKSKGEMKIVKPILVNPSKISLKSSSLVDSSPKSLKKTYEKAKKSRKDENHLKINKEKKDSKSKPIFSVEKTLKGIESYPNFAGPQSKIASKSKVRGKTLTAKNSNRKGPIVKRKIMSLSDTDSSSDSSHAFGGTTKRKSLTAKRKIETLSDSYSSNDSIVTGSQVKKKRKVGNSRINAVKYSGFVSKSSSSTPSVALPRLEEGILWPKDLTGKNLKRCEDFDMGGCKRGSRCRKVHICPSLGMRLKELDQNTLWAKDPILGVPSSSIMIEEVEEKGKLWYTAAYEDPVTGIIYHAEHLQKEHKCQGICWFLSDHEAYKSLRKVLYLALKGKIK